MFDKIQQLMQVQKQAEQMKKELEATEVEVNDVAGIKIKINGTQNFKSILIDELLINRETKDRLQADLLQSVNAAIKASQNLAAKKMKDVTGLDIPGL